MTIYRIEDRNGFGPYCNSDHGWMVQDHDHNVCTPSPLPWAPVPDDKLVQLMDLYEIDLYACDYRFGFKSLEQLNNWFNADELENLYKRGFNIIKYEVHNYIASEHQAIFRATNVISKEPYQEVAA